MRRFSFICIICLVISFTILEASSNTFEDPEFEWKVAERDSMTYTYTKFFDSRDSDGNSDPHSRTLPVTNTEGEKVNILMKKGLKVKVEIIDLDPYLSVQLSFNGLTTPVGRYRSIFYGKVVQQTVDNKTYWESQSYQTTESTIFENFTRAGYVSGTNFVYSSNGSSDNFNISSQSIRKYNWKTGWLKYLHLLFSNETHLIQELEISTKIPGFFPDFDLSRLFLPVTFLLTFMIMVVISNRRHK